MFHSNAPVNSASDIWSLGILIIRLMTGNFAYIDCLSNAAGSKKLDYSVLQEAIKSDIFTPSLRDFLGLCIITDMEKRATAKELLNHIWITEMESQRQK
jgi:serine/threonine protein kinase